MRLAAVLCAVSLQITACTGLFSEVGSAAPAVNIPGPAVDEPVGAAGRPRDRGAGGWVLLGCAGRL